MAALTVDAISALIAKMNGVDVGAWDDGGVRAALAALGFTPGTDLSFETGLSTGPGLIVPAPEGGSSPVLAVRVPVGSAAHLGDVVAIASGVIGHRASFLGGPPLFARWLRPIEGAVGTSTGLTVADGKLWVELVATMTWENWAYRVFKWGEGVAAVPYRWMAFKPHKSLHGMTTGGREVSSWREIEKGLRYTLGDLLEGLDGFRPVSGGDLEARFRMTTDQRNITSFFDVTLQSGRRIALRSTMHGLGELGWQKQQKRTWLCEWGGASAGDVADAASVIMRTMRSWNIPDGRDGDEVREKWVPAYTKARFADRSVVDLPGFGFGRSSDN
jgi:hypothetical protein